MRILRYILDLRRLPFVRDVLTIQAGSVILMGAGFISSIIFARFLGKESYGLYAVVLAFAGTAMSFFNIGQGQSLYVFFAEAYGKKDRRAMSAVLANFLSIALVNMLLLGILAWIMPMLSTRFYGSPTIGYYGQILCFFQMSEIWNGMTNVLLQSIRRIRMKVILEQAANLSYLGLAVIAVMMGGGIKSILLVQLSVSLLFLPISLIMLAYAAKKYDLPGIRECLRIPLRESSQYLVQGLMITADKIIGNFFPQGLFFLVSLFSSASFIGIARISLQLANVPRSLLLPQAGDLSMAAFGTMMARGPQIIRTNAAKLIKHALIFHAFLSLVGVLVVPFIIMHFYGQEYWDAIPLTLWLLLVLLVSPLTIANAPLLRLFRKIHWSIIINLLNWVLMAGSILLIKVGLSPMYGFVLACTAFYGTPILVTICIFQRLLQKRI